MQTNRKLNVKEKIKESMLLISNSCVPGVEKVNQLKKCRDVTGLRAQKF